MNYYYIKEKLGDPCCFRQWNVSRVEDFDGERVQQVADARDGTTLALLEPDSALVLRLAAHSLSVIERVLLEAETARSTVREVLRKRPLRR